MPPVDNTLYKQSLSFGLLHASLQATYGHACCPAHLSSGGDRLRKLISRARKAFDKAASHLHSTRQFAYEDKPVQELHQAINASLQDALSGSILHQVPDVLRQKLQTDVFVFSGMKTYAELKEASQLLTTPQGQPKPFSQFAEDIKKLNKTYNEDYLRTEHQFAMGSAQMAAQWAEVNPKNDLQYRTAQDSKVRSDHAAMHGITLPATDAFWDSYYPPNGWNCRCLAVEVLPGQYARSISDEAIAQGDAATTQPDKNGRNMAAMFRFNPGKQGVVFPPSHPYYAQHCGKHLHLRGSANSIRITLNNEKDKCQWQQKTKDSTLVSQKIKEYGNGGSINQSILVNQLAKDYKNVYQCCDHFAKNGQQTEILPKVHKDDPAYQNFFGDLMGTKYEGKCPDFRVNGKYYELEGFTTNNLDKAVNNMLKRGLKQASRIVIEDVGLSITNIKRTIFYRKKGGITIDEVWIFKNGVLQKVD
ncbi:MAG TPA: phage minor head protein [Niabella sp.]|nr:phage minor head protein [Niabella sp.]HQW14280.1 phage minor head protein [Niabella sp.]HQX18440.1 phage minor head protein [Niabella sp.]HQX40068.1 phage minor head protein [Niabella sp.]HRB05967.1 phage minor head protein [Niabella sp.]